MGRLLKEKKIRNANKAAAAARLLNGDFQTWHDFLKPRTDDFSNFARRNINAGYSDVKKRLSKELSKYCKRNFENMTVRSLVHLYDNVNENYGFQAPLSEFEETYAKFNKHVLRDVPSHATVHISLWGLQFRFPEDDIAKQLISSITLLKVSSKDLDKLKGLNHKAAVDKRHEIAKTLRDISFSASATMLFCFNLVEAYLNGLAWTYVQTEEYRQLKSKRKKEIFQDTGKVSLRKKITKYPEIISGEHLWNISDEGNISDEDLKTFLEELKPFRDSLVHPSPFSAPESFGGYDKLQKLYAIDTEVTLNTANLTVLIIEKIHIHINQKEEMPKWLKPVSDLLEQ